MTADHHQRQQAAELSARHMRQAGLDMAAARKKAARQLGLDLRPGNPLLPSRREIEQALASQLSLFGADDRSQQLAHKRQAAREAMQFLQAYAPRLAGAVLDGSAQAHDPVIVHLHADNPEDVTLFLHEQRLPAQLDQARVHLADGNLDVPCWTLTVDGTVFQLWVLPLQALRSPPRHPLDHTPLPRANTAQLSQLLR
jgi:hypothetical protein